MTHENSSAQARFRFLSQVSDHQLKYDLHQLNQKNHRLEAELLLHLGELDQRRLYREEACSSAFGFCVTRMGYSEDVAYKRVGAARLLRQFPCIYDLLAEGRIHLTALMLLKPHLTAENHEECLLAACNKSKREVEMLVASRWPTQDAAASIRKLPLAKPAALLALTSPSSPPTALERPEASPTKSAIETMLPPVVSGAAADTGAPTSPTVESTKAFGLTATPTGVAPRVSSSRQAAQVAPLSSSTYRVTFTASEQLKRKLDLARELLSHRIPPSDLPALIERALDHLLEREQTRRYGAKPHRPLAASLRKDCPAEPSLNLDSAPAEGEAVAGRTEKCPTSGTAGHQQAPADSTGPTQQLLMQARESHNPQDPDPNWLVNDVSTVDDAAATTASANASANASAEALAKTSAPARTSQRRQPKAAVRRAVFERDAGQCTFVDREGRRCSERHFLEFDHIEAYAIGGSETVSNLRMRCASHNALEAERLFGQQRVKNAIACAQQRGTR